MGSELKPCPFCGGGQNSHEDWCFILMCLVNEEQAIFGNKRLFTEDDLSNAWNTRAERTCKNIGNPYDGPPDYEQFGCSECGWKGSVDVNEFVDWNARYCPNCGARVVGD